MNQFYQKEIGGILGAIVVSTSPVLASQTPGYSPSYPNKWDQRNAKALNQSPGGYIMIHGEPQKKTYMKDWTNGCIALSNKHMQDFDKIVSIKTPVLILK